MVKLRPVWFMWIGLMVLVAGCQTRHIAPEVSYDPEQVQTIRETVDEIDWSEFE